MAINRQELIDNVTQGGQMPAMAIVPPTMFPENEKGYFNDNDVNKAKEYLQKGLEELGLTVMLLSFQQLLFHIIQMTDIKRLLKLFKICGRLI